MALQYFDVNLYFNVKYFDVTYTNRMAKELVFFIMKLYWGNFNATLKVSMEIKLFYWVIILPTHIEAIYAPFLMNL